MRRCSISQKWTAGINELEKPEANLLQSDFHWTLFDFGKRATEFLNHTPQRFSVYFYADTAEWSENPCGEWVIVEDGENWT